MKKIILMGFSLLLSCHVSAKDQFVAPNHLDRLKLPSAQELRVLKGNFVEHRKKDGSLGDNFSTAVFGIVKDMTRFGDLEAPYSVLDIPNSYMKGKLRAHLHISRDVKRSDDQIQWRFHHGNKKRKAPLAIIMNPLFSDSMAKQMNRFADYFAKKGYHVIVFMNPWSMDVVTRAPKFMVGDIWSESKMHLEAIDHIIDTNIGRENVTGATMVGLSYGAFLSTVIKSMDMERSRPLINGPVIPLSPPLSMLNSLRNVDRDGDESEVFGSHCIRLATLGGGIRDGLGNLFSADHYHETEMDTDCSKYFLAHIGFKVTLKMTMTALSITKGLWYSPREINEMTYESYMTNYSGLEPKVEELDIGYWLSQSARRGFNKFLVVTSKDDSINAGLEFTDNEHYRFHDGNFINLPTGGHTGFRSSLSKDRNCKTDWTHCLFDRIYNH